jgi:predicted RNA-binding Zn-ribbon protein involved in translation (DUF1610 family)
MVIDMGTFLDDLMCPKCKVYLKTDGKVVVLGCDVDRRRVNVQRCPRCGLEVYANMGKKSMAPWPVDVEVNEL